MTSLQVIADTLPNKPKFLIGSNGSAIMEYKTKKIIKVKEMVEEVGYHGKCQK